MICEGWVELLGLSGIEWENNKYMRLILQGENLGGVIKMLIVLIALPNSLPISLGIT